MSLPLANQTALVTGASRGIGRAIAQRLAADGAHVLVHYGRSRGAADSLIEEITAAGGSAEAVEADLATVEGTTELVDQVKTILGTRKLDVLVNNAGVAEFAAFEDTDAGVIDRQLAVNVRAPFLIASGLSGALADDARVVFTSSVVARAAFAGALAYSQTKGAVNTLVRSLAATVGPRGIRVNAVDPGWVRTDMGGRNAPRSLEQGAASVLFGVSTTETGGVFHDGRRVPL